MDVGIRSQCIPDYRILTEDQIQELHRATLEVLQSVGVRVNHDEAVEMLRSAGCWVKRDNVVQFPSWLVEECIRSTPSCITIYNHSGEEAMRLEGRNSYFGLGTDLINTYDLKVGELRPSLLEDVVNAARVAEHCDQIDFIASMALPHDVPTNTMYIHCVKAMLENASKPIFATAAGAEDLSVIIEMAEAVTGGREELKEKPFLIHYSEPTPPLVHSFGAVNKLFLCAEKGVPVVYVPAATLGGSAPVTLSLGVVQANAEALSGIVLHQLRRMGAPIISGWVVVPLDMRAATFCYGSPEVRLTNSVFADLYHYYGIPQWSTVGSDSHVFDQQAAMEHAMGILLAALDGSNLIHDVGYLGQGLIQNPAMLVMCNEIISYAKRIMRGFELRTDLMDLDVIREVGPGGNYLAEKHTVRNFRQELWQPGCLNRDNLYSWQQKGAKSYGETVVQTTLEILENYTPNSLSAAVREKIETIVKKADNALVDAQFKA